MGFGVLSVTTVLPYQISRARAHDIRAEVSGFLRRNATKLVASILITCGVVYTVERGGLQLVPDGGDFSQVRWTSFLLFVPLFLGMTWFRSVRWRFLLREIIEVPKTRLLAVSCAGFLAMLLLPFRIGELARPYLLRTRPEEVTGGKPVLSMTAATSSIIAERVIDGVFLSIVLAIVLVTVPTMQPLPERVVGLPISVTHVRFAGFATLVLFLTALVTITVFYFSRTLAQRITQALVGKFSPRLADKIADFASHLADGLHVFRRWRDALGFLAETAAYWTCNALAMWVLARGCGVIHADGSAITFPEACGLLGLLGCSIMIPGPPGLLGVFQAGIYAAMTMYFPEHIVIGPGAAYVFLFYITTVVITIVTGAWGIWHEGGTRRLRGALDPSLRA
jgi:glycosyltransferase 2 family protein